MSQYPVPAVDSMLAARQTQAPEHAPQDASIDATFAEQPGRAAEVADSSTSLPSQLLSGSELSQASHEVDPLWRGDENLFGDEDFNFGHQSAQNQDPIDPCLHGFDETIFAKMLTNATRGNEAGISTATTQDSSGGASQYTEHLRPENALLTAEVDERINETSNKIEDFRHLLQAELSDRVRDFEDLMGAVQFEIELQATSPFMHPRFKSWMNTEQKVKDFEIVLQTNCPDLLPDFRRLIRSVQKGKSRA